MYSVSHILCDIHLGLCPKTHPFHSVLPIRFFLPFYTYISVLYLVNINTGKNDKKEPTTTCGFTVLAWLRTGIERQTHTPAQRPRMLVWPWSVPQFKVPAKVRLRYTFVLVEVTYRGGDGLQGREAFYLLSESSTTELMRALRSCRESVFTASLMLLKNRDQWWRLCLCG